MFENINDKTREKYEKMLAYIGIALIVVFTSSLVKNIGRVVKANKRIADAQNKVTKLQNENEELKKDLGLVLGDQYIEKQLRDKLGLAKEGETILILPDEEFIKKLVPELEEAKEQLPEPNWKKWVNLFF